MVTDFGTNRKPVYILYTTSY